MTAIEIITIIICFILGAVLGSFACCQAWRLRLKQLKKSNPGKWSVCLSCGHRLKPYENIPIFSWFLQRGRCKHCGARIGKAEIFSELSLGLAGAAFGAFFYHQFNTLMLVPETPMLILKLSMLIMEVLMLTISITIMWILLVYDAKWQELPVRLLTILNICAIICTILRFVGLAFSSQTPVNLIDPLLSTLGAVAILAGLYLALYLLSGERLVGSGDWLVALPIALLLGNWWLGLLTLFLSNLLASIIGVASKSKQNPKASTSSKLSHLKIPFGPFLIIAFVAIYTMQPWLLSLLQF